MAILNCGFYAHGLKKNTHVLVFLPQDSLPKVTLWLLHSEGGSCRDWLYNTNAERYAEQAGAALVLPSSDRCDFTDSTAIEIPYLGEELPTFLKKLVSPLSRAPETLIAGAGTGAAGAKFLAQKYPDCFCCAANLISGTNWDLLDGQLRRLFEEIS